MCDHCGCRNIPTIAELTAEHVDILARAWGIVEHTRAGTTAPTGAVDALLALLDVHVAKEETGLYPELMALGELTPEVNANLEREHVEVREAIVAGGFDHHDYYELARHIELEEHELFSAARYEFEEPEWANMRVIHDIADRHSSVTASGWAAVAEAARTLDLDYEQRRFDD